MKKNITINMFGSLYAIDEDAYALLKSYLENMRRYFSKKEGGDEIADDVEHRVAELMEELKQSGKEACDIDDVQNIIHRIGDPEQMDSGETADSSDAGGTDSEETDSGTGAPSSTADRVTDWLRRRRLYRDEDDKMLGGVLSGLCHYFGGTDPLPWRIAMVLLCFLSFSTVAIIYLVLWLFVPAAQTAEQKLQMRGKTVNAQSINDEIIRNATAANPASAPQQKEARGRSLINTLLHALVILLKVGVACFVGMIVIGMLLAAFTVLTFATTSFTILTSVSDCDPLLPEALNAIPYSIVSLVVIAFCLLAAVGILLYLLVRFLTGGTSGKSLSLGRIVLLVLSLVLALCVAGILGGILMKNFDDAQFKVLHDKNTVNGIYLEASERNRLAADGVHIMKLENCNNWGGVYEQHESFFNDEVVDSHWAFVRDLDNQPMIFDLQKTVTLPAGNYRLEIISQASAPGCFGYTVDSAGVYTNLVPLPAYVKDVSSNIGRTPYELAYTMDYFKQAYYTKEDWDDIAERAEHWSFSASQPFRHAGGTITFGVTCDQSKTQQPSGSCEWCNVCDMRIVEDRGQFFVPGAPNQAGAVGNAPVIDTVNVTQPALSAKTGKKNKKK